MKTQLGFQNGLCPLLNRKLYEMGDFLNLSLSYLITTALYLGENKKSPLIPKIQLHWLHTWYNSILTFNKNSHLIFLKNVRHVLRTSYLFYDYFKVDTFFSHAVIFSGATGRHMMSHILCSNFKFDAICVTFLHKSVQYRAVVTRGQRGRLPPGPPPPYLILAELEAKHVPSIFTNPQIFRPSYGPEL